MKYLSKFITSIFIVSIFMGCQTQPNIASDPYFPVVVESALKGELEVVNSISRQRDDGLLEVQFSLKNLKPYSDVDALYKIRWFDRSGFMIKSITDTLIRIHLGSNEQKIFNIISTSPKAVKYEIKILDYEENKKRSQNDNFQNSN